MIGLKHFDDRSDERAVLSLSPADAIPYSIMTLETAQQIERMVRENNPDFDDRIQLDYRRFRPNFVVSGMTVTVVGRCRRLLHRPSP